jgi:peptidoglycan/LPS O-acetylase OafA/YrhL
MRGFACLAVMFCHSPGDLMRGGFLGVDVFLVLSGFLITTLLLQEWQRTGTIRLGRFYLSRALRLLPALVAMLFVFWIYTEVFLTHDEIVIMRAAVGSILGYFANYHFAHRYEPIALTHTWSLSMEEQFYAVWPAILLVLLRLRLPYRLIVITLGAAILATAAWRLTPASQHIARMHEHLDTRADGFLSGCLVAFLATMRLEAHAAWSRRLLQNLALALALLLCWLCVDGRLQMPHFIQGGFTIVALAVGLILVSLLREPPSMLRTALEWRALVAVGRLSYGLYIWHVPVIWTMARHRILTSHSTGLVLLTSFGITFLIASLSHRWIEQPCLRLKDRLRSRPVAAPAMEPIALQKAA